MDEVISTELTGQKDEVGILSRSFELMVKNIKGMIAKLNDSNNEIELSKKALETGNKELQELNQFMVGRELKMIELKNRINELEKKENTTA